MPEIGQDLLARLGQRPGLGRLVVDDAQHNDMVLPEFNGIAVLAALDELGVKALGQNSGVCADPLRGAAVLAEIGGLVDLEAGGLRRDLQGVRMFITQCDQFIGQLKIARLGLGQTIILFHLRGRVFKAVVRPAADGPDLDDVQARCGCNNAAEFVFSGAEQKGVDLRVHDATGHKVMFAEFQRLALGAELRRDLGELPAFVRERQRGLDHGPGLRLGAFAGSRFHRQPLQRALFGDVILGAVVFIIGPEAGRIDGDTGGDFIQIELDIGDPDLFRLKVIGGIGRVICADLLGADLDLVHKPVALQDRIADVAGLSAESPDARRFLSQHKQAFR